MKTSSMILAAVGVLVGGYAIAAAAQSSPAAPGPQPGPQPVPGPTPIGPVPPPTNLDQLRQYEQQLLQAAVANPQSVDPALMDQAAAELDQVGLPQDAAQVRAAAVAVRAARGGGILPPIPNPQPQPQPIPPLGPLPRTPAPAPQAPGMPAPAPINPAQNLAATFAGVR